MAFLRCDAGMAGSWRRTAGPEHEGVAHEGLVETGEFKVSPHDLMHGVNVRVRWSWRVETSVCDT